jgi:iron complex transport system ATP-binding protein
MSLLRVDKATVNLKGRDIFRNVSFTGEARELILISGKNGCGKTTLLRAICGLQKLTAGKILINGCDIASLRAPERGKLISWLPSEYHVPFNYACRDIVMTGRFSVNHGRKNDADESSVNAILTALDLSRLADKGFLELSSGERRRVMIARTLASPAQIIVLDEPLANLDSDIQELVLEVLQRIARDGKLIILSSHELARTREAATRHYKLSAGS